MGKIQKMKKEDIAKCGFAMPPIYFAIDGDLVFLADQDDAPVLPYKSGGDAGYDAFRVEDWPAFVEENGKEAGKLVRSTYYDDEGNGEEIVCEDIRNPKNERKLLRCWVFEEDARADLIDRMFCTDTDPHYAWISEWSKEYLRVRQMFSGYIMHHPHEEAIELMDEFADKIVDDWHVKCDGYGLTEEDDTDIWCCFDNFAYDYDEYKLFPPIRE